MLTFNDIDISNITSNVIDTLLSLNRKSALEFLRITLKIDELDWDEYSKEVIFIEYLYGVIEFTTTKGFSVNCITNCVLFAFSLLQQTITRQSTLVNAITLCKQLSIEFSSNGQIVQEKLAILYNYLSESIFKHYYLYQCVFNADRTKNHFSGSFSVNIPLDSQELETAKPKQIWEYEQFISKVEESVENRLRESNILKETVKTKAENEAQNILNKITQTEFEIEKKNVSNIIMEVLKIRMKEMSDVFCMDFDETTEKMNSMIEKRMHPRPAEMGQQSKNSKALKNEAENTKKPPSARSTKTARRSPTKNI